MTAIFSLLAGGEWVDDVNALRAGGLGAAILGMTPAAASTVGTFLRAFTSGHARQLDAAQGDLPQRAWAVAARPIAKGLRLSPDSTPIETYGPNPPAATHFTYPHPRGHHPPLALTPSTAPS